MEAKRIDTWKYAGAFGALVVVLLLVAYSAGFLGSFYSSLDRYIDRTMKDLHVPGVALVIVQDDKVVYAKGYGVLEIGKPDKVTPDTPFQIGSCTKAFTAASVGLLIDEGKLTWEDKAQKHLPDFKLYDPYMTKELTLADMLCHRSGLEDIGLLYFMSPLSRDQIIYQMRYLSSLSDFRVLAVYINFMFLAAGQIVARVSGMSWDDFIMQRFLNPLKVKDSVASIREFKNQAALAKPHMYLNGKTIAMTPLDLHNVGPAGSIISTANDLVNWVRLQLNNGQLFH